MRGMGRLYAWILLGSVLCLETGCGGSSSVPTANLPTVDPLTGKQVALATHMTSGHLDNGLWDWRQMPPFDTSASGFQNVSGVTALGLLETWLCDQLTISPQLPTSVLTALEETRDALIAKMEDFLDPNGATTSISLPNFIFIKRMWEAGLATQAHVDVAKAAFHLLILLRDASDGSDATVLSDGVWNRIHDGRAGIPGIRGWDLTFLYKALVCLDWPQVEIDWVFERTATIDVPRAQPGQDTDGFGVYGVTHVVQLCALHGDAIYAPLWRFAFEEYRIPMGPGMEAMGWWNEGAGTLGADHQGSSYGALALAARGEDPSALQAWLASEIGMDGSLVESDGFQYFELMGECLQALLAGAPKAGGAATKPAGADLQAAPAAVGGPRPRAFVFRLVH